MRHIFTIYHPTVILCYLVGVLSCAMLTLQPVYVLLSVGLGLLYTCFLYGFKTTLRTLAALAGVCLVVSLVNPLFNHKGLTVLFELFDNPITLEATLYGLCTGGMLLAVLLWFQCYQKLMTQEKFLYLFGRILPTLALMVSMILKLIPQSQYKVHCIEQAQAGLAGGHGNATRRQGLHRAVRTASILVSWSMEDAIETADSMRARGYGAARRTTYSNFRLAAQDGWALAFLALALGGNLFAILTYGQAFTFYPRLSPVSGVPLWAYGLYAVMLAFPLILEVKERWAWRA